MYIIYRLKECYFSMWGQMHKDKTMEVLGIAPYCEMPALKQNKCQYWTAEIWCDFPYYFPLLLNEGSKIGGGPMMGRYIS